MVPGQLCNYTLQRGPTLAASDVHVERGKLADIWLYNFDTQALNVRWRITSGTESVCGLDSDMQPRSDCASPDHWPEATLGPARSDPLVFTASDSWFNLWTKSEFRQAELELRFGADNAAPLARLPLRLHLDDPFYPAVQFVSHLLRVIFWVTLGAAFLMLAQVMIPNFRRCLEMESQIEGLQEDLRAIDSSVGSRLYSRCQQGINSVRRGLAMRERIAESGWKSVSNSALRIWYRFALAGNTTEVDRLGTILPRIESRIRLTERLDERDSATGSDYAQIPPSFCWNREQQLLAVQEILAGQIIADADETNASRLLDQLSNDATSMKEFAEQLENRVEAMQKQFAVEPWKSKSTDLLRNLNGCAELLGETSGTRPANLTLEQLIFRDTCAVRLEIVSRLIFTGALLDADDKVRGDIIKKLQSISPARLATARIDLMKISEGISDEDVKEALKTGMWDAVYEPIDPTDQDVIRMSLQFRNKDLNRSTARNGFQCFWHIVADGAERTEQINKDETPKKEGTGATPEASAKAETSAKPEAGATTEPGEGYYEDGWQTQFILPPGDNVIEPLVQDISGKKVPLLNEDGIPRDPIHIEVGQQTTSTVYSRAVRGLIDASITALVPVFTVAFTQFQNGGDLTVVKLILLGFTSQAIRSAVLPESVSVSAKSQSAKAGPPNSPGSAA
jgi:hypothetical protein